MSRVAVPVLWREILHLAADGNRHAKVGLDDAGTAGVGPELPLPSAPQSGSYELFPAGLD